MEISARIGTDGIALAVSQVRRRIRLLRTQDWAVVGFTGAAVLSLGLVLATRLQWWLDAVDYVPWLLLFGGVCGALYGASRAISNYDAARVADERAALDERLSTATRLLERGTTSPAGEAQLEDAARAASSLSVTDVLPYRAPRRLAFLAVAALVLTLSVFLPEWGFFMSDQDREDRRAMQREGEKIQRIAKEIEKKAGSRTKEEDAATLKRLAQDMRRLGRDQSRNRISKKQALLKMEDLKEQLNEAAAKDGANRTRQRQEAAADLEQAANEAGKKGQGEQASQLRRMAESLKAGDLKAAEQQLRKIEEKVRQGKLSSDDMKDAAATLSEMAKAMDKSQVGEAGKELAEASKELREAAQKLDSLQKQMEQAKSPQERQELEKQMSQAQMASMRKAADSIGRA